MATDLEKTEDEYWVLISYLLKHHDIKYVYLKSMVISSVVPSLTDTFESMAFKYLKTKSIIVNYKINKNISLSIDNPKELGSDRLVNAMAGYEIYGGPLIIIDFGTATTFCALSSEGEYLGGAISPGLLLSLGALSGKTAKLPQIRLEFPESAIGKNTIWGMQSGVLYGYLGLVNEIIKRFKTEMHSDSVFVIATGGLSSIISAKSNFINEINPDLTLEGLRIVYELNS